MKIWLRGGLIVASLFLSSCQSTIREWHEDCVVTPNASYNSKRLYLPPEPPLCNIEVELVLSESDSRFYINTLSIPFSHLSDDVSKTIITFGVGDLFQEFIVDRLLGGQRLLLSPEASAFVIDALVNNQCVCLKVGRYQADIVPTGFFALYTHS